MDHISNSEDMESFPQRTPEEQESLKHIFDVKNKPESQREWRESRRFSDLDSHITRNPFD